MASPQSSPAIRTGTSEEDVFVAGTADEIVNYIREIIPGYPRPGDDFWVKKSNRMLKVVLEAMVWLREQGMIDLDATEILEFTTLQRVIDLADENLFPDMPAEIRGCIRSYLANLPGYDPTLGHDQPEETCDHHKFHQLFFVKALGA